MDRGFPLDTERKLNVHKAFRKDDQDVLHAFNSRSVGYGVNRQYVLKCNGVIGTKVIKFHLGFLMPSFKKY